MFEIMRNNIITRTQEPKLSVSPWFTFDHRFVSRAGNLVKTFPLVPFRYYVPGGGSTSKLNLPQVLVLTGI